MMDYSRATERERARSRRSQVVFGAGRGADAKKNLTNELINPPLSP